MTKNKQIAYDVVKGLDLADFTDFIGLLKHDELDAFAEVHNIKIKKGLNKSKKVKVIQDAWKKV